MKVVLDSASMKLIALFEQMTGAHIKDCIQTDQQALFIVQQGELGKAVGKGGQHVRTLEQRLKKKVKIVAFDPDLAQFIKNLIAPLEANVIVEDELVTMTAKDLKTRGLLIGRAATHLRHYEGIVKRYFPIKELKVA